MSAAFVFYAIPGRKRPTYAPEKLASIRDMRLGGMTLTEVARVFHIHRSTLQELIHHHGLLPKGFRVEKPRPKAPPKPIPYGRRPCEHCKERVACKQKRLCFRCRRDPEIRALYPPTSKFCRRGVGYTPARQLPAPTAFLPGSPEKQEVLRQRAANGELLWHPDDAGADPELRGLGVA